MVPVHSSYDWPPAARANKATTAVCVLSVVPQATADRFTPTGGPSDALGPTGSEQLSTSSGTRSLRMEGGTIDHSRVVADHRKADGGLLGEVLELGWPSLGPVAVGHGGEPARAGGQARHL